jgi:uncharacterized protein YdhG (YjbR/CyaY superfamily)
MRTDIKIRNVDEYIAIQPLALREMLEEIRTLIHSVIPAAEEVISYMIPCYKHHGMLVGFGAHKGGCSFYAMNTKILNTYAKELARFKYTGSTIHVDPKQPLPVALLTKIIKQRVKENEEKARLKKQSKAK